MIKRKGPTKDDIIKAYNNEIIRLGEWVERLQEQLSEANDIIKYYAEKHGKLKACDYLNKWGVK